MLMDFGGFGMVPSKNAYRELGLSNTLITSYESMKYRYTYKKQYHEIESNIN